MTAPVQMHPAKEGEAVEEDYEASAISAYATGKPWWGNIRLISDRGLQAV